MLRDLDSVEFEAFSDFKGVVKTRQNNLTQDIADEDKNSKSFIFMRDLISERQTTKLLWLVNDLQTINRSCVVNTRDGTCWMFELRATQ